MKTESNNKCRVLIINEGFSSNLGDQAINGGISNLFTSLGYKVNFSYLSRPRLSSLPKYEYYKSQVNENENTSLFIIKLKSFLSIFYWVLYNLQSLISELKTNDYDVVVFGGGQLINSTLTSQPSRFSIAIFWWTRLIPIFSKRTKIYFIGVGSEVSFNVFEKFFFQKSLDRANGIWVRDKYSKKRIEELFGHKAELMPDVAFYSDCDSNVNTTNIERERIALVGISSFTEVFRKFKGSAISKDDYYKEWYKIVNDYESEGFYVKLFYTTLSDAIETRSFVRFVKDEYGRDLEVALLNSLDDLKSLYKASQAVYSGRMHALLLGMKSGCEVKPYLISQKLESFYNEYILSQVSLQDLSDEIRNKFMFLSCK